MTYIGLFQSGVLRAGQQKDPSADDSGYGGLVAPVAFVDPLYDFPDDPNADTRYQTSTNPRTEFQNDIEFSIDLGDRFQKRVQRNAPSDTVGFNTISIVGRMADAPYIREFTATGGGTVDNVAVYTRAGNGDFYLDRYESGIELKTRSDLVRFVQAVASWPVVAIPAVGNASATSQVPTTLPVGFNIVADQFQSADWMADQTFAEPTRRARAPGLISGPVTVAKPRLTSIAPNGQLTFDVRDGSWQDLDGTAWIFYTDYRVSSPVFQRYRNRSPVILEIGRQPDPDPDPDPDPSLTPWAFTRMLYRHVTQTRTT